MHLAPCAKCPAQTPSPAPAFAGAALASWSARPGLQPATRAPRAPRRALIGPELRRLRSAEEVLRHFRNGGEALPCLLRLGALAKGGAHVQAASVAHVAACLEPEALAFKELCAVLVALAQLRQEAQLRRFLAQLQRRRLSGAQPRELANAAWACAKGNPSSGAPCLQHIASASLQSGRLCTGFTAIDVAQLSWSLATVQLREAPAMAACAAFAAAESESFGAQGLANCAWAMAGSWPAAVAALLDEASARLGGGQFTSQHVANLAWAAAVTKLRHEFFASPDLKLPGSPRHLANLGWALGTLQLRSPLLYQLSEQAVGMGLHSFRDEELAGLLHAVASSGLAAPRFLRSAEEALLQRSLGCTELAGACWALSVCSSRAADPLLALAATRAKELSPQGLANVAWAAALREAPLWRLEDSVRDRLEEFSVQGLVNLTWAFTQAQHQPPGLRLQLMQMSLGRLSEMKALELSSLTWCLAFGDSNNATEKVAAEVASRLPQDVFDARQLANVAWAFATLSTGGVGLFQQLACAVLERLPESSAQGLSNIAWAFGSRSFLGGPLLFALQAQAPEKLPLATEQGLALLAWALAPEKPQVAPLRFLEALQLEIQARMRASVEHAKTKRRPEISGYAAAEEVEQSLEQVGHCRAEGNAQLGAGEALAALESYSNGIELCAKHSITGKLLGQLYVNRAQAQARLERHDLALQDCRAGLQEDPGNGRGYWRGASSALKLRQGDEAARLCMRGIKVLGDSASLESLLEEAKAQIEKDKTAIVEEEEETEVSVGQALADRAASLLLAFRQDPSRADDLRQRP
ncbi:unnamed protein product [Effrenium voratum]|nr:unnamed protein product [Effrenium voratum]